MLSYADRAVELFTFLFLLAAGTVFLVLVIMLVVDLSQTANAVRRNYPVIGRFRHMFETLGEFMRQYMFAMDREELPFNRAQRNWVDRASGSMPMTVAFGSTREMRWAGTAIFANAPFGLLEEECRDTSHVTVGKDGPNPYTTNRIFNISAMSFGAISKPAVMALGKGAAMAGCWMNTGEGGLSPWHLEAGNDVVFQFGTAKNGVRTPDGALSEERLKEVGSNPQVKMIEIKLSQGAKPGKGGILPGAKVTEEIARIRGLRPGQDAISPNRHREVRNSGELLDLIARVRDIGGKPTGYKAVIGNPRWLDELFELINQRGPDSAPDFITVDSGDGGTGAAPMPLMDNVGMLLRESLVMLVDALNRHGLRERIRVVSSGKLITPSEVAWALCAGADFAVSARGFMFALGCIQAMRCNKNTCPTGITTHNRRLQRGLNPRSKAVSVANYQQRIEEELKIIAHSCGVAEPRLLRREHCRIVQPDGQSRLLSEIYPRAA